MTDKVYVVTAWNSKTGVDVCIVYADRADADAEYEKFMESKAGKAGHIYGGVYERIVRK